MTSIARRAGVGVATLFRHFPNKQDLLQAVFDRRLAECDRVIDDALADPEPWRGFCSVLEHVCATQVAARGFTAAFMSQYGEQRDDGGQLAHAHDKLDALIQRAKAAGRLRPEFEIGDVIMVLFANDGLATAAPSQAPVLSRRLVAYLLQVFAVGPRDGLSSKQLTPLPTLDLAELRRQAVARQ